MSLKIRDGQGKLIQFWKTNNAYQYIINNGNNPDNNTALIMVNEPLAKKILSDWVWASNYRIVRMTSGLLPFIRQYAYKRIYPTREMAKIALVAEIQSHNNWKQETNFARKIIKNGDLHEQVFKISQAIQIYLNDRPRLRKIVGNQTADYFLYYNGFILGVWNILQITVDKNNSDLATNIAIIHDLAVLLNNVLASPNDDDFISFDRNTLLMTVVNNQQQFQQVQANQIDGKGNILDQPVQNPMSWTLLGEGRFPDNRTINENHPAIQHARNLQQPVQMGPSRTTASMLHLANHALQGNPNRIALLANLTLGIFAFWNQSYNRRCTLIHCYHFVTDCAFCNFQVPLTEMSNPLPAL